jgi:hypothetical protein
VGEAIIVILLCVLENMNMKNKKEKKISKWACLHSSRVLKKKTHTEFYPVCAGEVSKNVLNFLKITVLASCTNDG